MQTQTLYKAIFTLMYNIVRLINLLQAMKQKWNKDSGQTLMNEVQSRQTEAEIFNKSQFKGIRSNKT